mmetsp:Transcript_81529/g.212012  ORF Transcript_81529/g.212012 Transcript_81529/m.212012 type:complete len:118 (+) Transcript_81529:229-582(+)
MMPWPFSDDVEIPNTIPADNAFGAPSAKTLAPIFVGLGIQAAVAMGSHDPVLVGAAMLNELPLTIVSHFRWRASSAKPLFPIRGACSIQRSVRGLIDDPVAVSIDKLKSPYAIVVHF